MGTSGGRVRVSIDVPHVVYNAITLLPDISDQKVALISIVLHDLWRVVDYGGSAYQRTVQLGLYTMHGTIGVDEGVITHIQGCEGLYGQVRNPFT